MKYSLDKYNFHICTKVDGTPYGVVATSTYAGRTVRGKAICDPRDTFSLEEGKKLAAARCNVKIAEKRAARAERKYKEAVALVVAQMTHRERMESYVFDSKAELDAARTELTDLENSL